MMKKVVNIKYIRCCLACPHEHTDREGIDRCYNPDVENGMGKPVIDWSKAKEIKGGGREVPDFPDWCPLEELKFEETKK